MEKIKYFFIRLYHHWKNPDKLWKITFNDKVVWKPGDVCSTPSLAKGMKYLGRGWWIQLSLLFLILAQINCRTNLNKPEYHVPRKIQVLDCYHVNGSDSCVWSSYWVPAGSDVLTSTGNE
jgi:hypothetical protein